MNKLISLLLICLSPAALALTLQSKDFSDNGVLDKKFAGADKSKPACTGQNVSPELNWSETPAGTKSFALLMTDPVGAKGLGVTHMVAYNIAAERSAFAQGELTQGKAIPAVRIHRVRRTIMVLVPCGIWASSLQLCAYCHRPAAVCA